MLTGKVSYGSDCCINGVTQRGNHIVKSWREVAGYGVIGALVGRTEAVIAEWCRRSEAL